MTINAPAKSGAVATVSDGYAGVALLHVLWFPLGEGTNPGTVATCACEDLIRGKMQTMSCRVFTLKYWQC